MDEDNEVDTNNQRGRYISQGTMMEICEKVDNTWQKYVKEGKITPGKFNPSND